MKIRKGDNVMMLAGKDRGKSGKILATMPGQEKVIVEGLNMLKRHTRARQRGQTGQIITKERAVHVAGVVLVCKSCGKQTRVGFTVNGDQKTRICKKCKSEV